MNIVSRKEVLKPGYQKSDFKVKNFKATLEGSQGQIMICDILTDWIVFINGHSTSKHILDEAWNEYTHTYPETDISVEDIGVIDTFGDDVDVVMVEKPQENFFLSDIEILKKNGFNRGAIIKVGSEFEHSYKIFTGTFEKDEFSNVLLLFTDNELVRREFCSIITDVNKNIIRYVTDEKERLMNELLEFQNTIDTKLHEVIFN
jgi:hypothetical protein